MTKLVQILSSFSLPLWRAGVGIALLAFVSCSSSQLFVDDAYHWPEKTNTGTTAISTENSAPAAATGTSAPGNSSSAATLEYISVQDTTITVRIKR